MTVNKLLQREDEQDLQPSSFELPSVQSDSSAYPPETISKLKSTQSLDDVESQESMVADDYNSEPRLRPLEDYSRRTRVGTRLRTRLIIYAVFSIALCFIIAGVSVNGSIHSDGWTRCLFFFAAAVSTASALQNSTILAKFTLYEKRAAQDRIPFSVGLAGQRECLTLAWILWTVLWTMLMVFSMMNGTAVFMLALVSLELIAWIWLVAIMNEGIKSGLIVPESDV